MPATPKYRFITSRGVISKYNSDNILVATMSMLFLKAVIVYDKKDGGDPTRYRVALQEVDFINLKSPTFPADIYFLPFIDPTLISIDGQTPHDFTDFTTWFATAMGQTPTPTARIGQQVIGGTHGAILYVGSDGSLSNGGDLASIAGKIPQIVTGTLTEDISFTVEAGRELHSIYFISDDDVDSLDIGTTDGGDELTSGMAIATTGGNVVYDKTFSLDDDTTIFISKLGTASNIRYRIVMM